MRKLLLATTMLLATTVAGKADFIQSLGNNPNSSTGHFSNSVLGTTFSDDFTFNLTGSPQFVAFASATNDFAVINGPDYITNFTGQLWSFGLNGVYNNGGVDDVAVNPVAFPHACADNPLNCQELSGSSILDAGGYFLRFTGTGGGTAGYGGDLTTAPLAVPGPVVGAGLPGLVAAGLFMVGLAKRRRNRAHA